MVCLNIKLRHEISTLKINYLHLFSEHCEIICTSQHKQTILAGVKDYVAALTVRRNPSGN